MCVCVCVRVRVCVCVCERERERDGGGGGLSKCVCVCVSVRGERKQVHNTVQSTIFYGRVSLCLYAPPMSRQGWHVHIQDTYFAASLETFS